MVIAPHRGGPEEGRGAPLRQPQEPARIRRGDGPPAQAASTATGRRSSTASNCKPLILDMIDEQIDAGVRRASSTTTTARPASPSSPPIGSASSSTPREFRGDFEEADKDAPGQGDVSTVPTVIQETDRGEPEPGRGPEGVEVAGAGRAVNAKYGLKLDRERSEEDRPDELTEYLIAKAEAAVQDRRSDRWPAVPRPGPTGAESLCDWVRQKFGVKVIDRGDRRPSPGATSTSSSSAEGARGCTGRRRSSSRCGSAMQNFMADKPSRPAASATTAKGCSAGRSSGSARCSPSGRRAGARRRQTASSP